MTLLSAFTWAEWYGTITPYILICLLYAITIITAFTGLKNSKSRSITLIVMPVCMIMGSILEFKAFGTLGKGAFWWCSEEKYGFWGAFWRLIPFMVVIYGQVMSYVLYKNILIWKEDPNEVSIKPMAKSFLLCIPLAFIVGGIVSAIWHINGSKLGDVFMWTFLIVLFAGTFKSAWGNVKLLGAGRGLAYTAFEFVYLIGLVIMIWGLVLVITQLWLQTLILIMVLPIIIAIGSGDKVKFVESKKSTSSSCVSRNYNGKWNDGFGGIHDFESDARRANEEGRRHERLSEKVRAFEEYEKRMKNGG